MPSTLMARSVPWSRLKPRKKYWLALPSPECWVTIRPGTASSTSPGRVTGRAFSSSPVKLVWLAMVGGDGGPEPTFGEPEPMLGDCGAGLAATERGTEGAGLRDARFAGACGFGCGACTETGGRSC